MPQVSFRPRCSIRSRPSPNVLPDQKEDQKELALQDLDDGVLGLILVRLDVASICSLACTCKGFAGTVFRQNFSSVWRAKLIELLPYAPLFLPKQAPRGNKWSDVVTHVVKSLKGPSDKMVREAVKDTAEPVVGGTEPRMEPANRGAEKYYRGAAKARNMFYGEPDISVNPMLAWNHRAQVQNAFRLSHIDDRVGPSRQRAEGNACGAACIRSAYPFNNRSTSVVGIPAIRYIEIEITDMGTKGKICVGVVHGQQAMHWMRSGTHLGTNSGPWAESHDTIGWHVHNGVIYPDKADVRWHARGAQFAPPVSAPAVLGCGMDIVGNTLFYTLNGAVIGSVLPSGREHNTSRVQPGQGLVDEDDEYDQQLEAVPSNAQERFLESIMSLRRSDRVSSTTNLEGGTDLLAALTCEEELDVTSSGSPSVAALSSRRPSIMPLPVGTASLTEHEVHAIDVAHCIFAVSLSGGAAASLNLGQRKFQFDLGGLYTSAPPAGSRAGSLSDQGGLSVAGRESVTGQSLKHRSIAGSMSVKNWRLSVGGMSMKSAQSRRSFGGLFQSEASDSGSGDTFCSCETKVTKVGMISGALEKVDLSPEMCSSSNLAHQGREERQIEEAYHPDKPAWQKLSINVGSELHDAVTPNGGGADEDLEKLGILTWLGVV